MQEVAIVGAGELGGAVAHVLARHDLVRKVTLVDDAGRVAAGKALDIAQAAPVERFSTQLSGATDMYMAAGASVIVIADRVGGTEWQGEEGLLLLKRVRQMAPNAVVVCVGASQRELVDRGVRELRYPRARLFGSAPEALASGARALVALALNGSPRDVALTVLGVPPHHTVIPWADTALAGFALTRLLEEPSRRLLAARVSALWPPGPYALASAATMVIESMAGRSRRMASCFVAADAAAPEAGTHTRTGAMPVRLGPAGIVEVVLPSLNAIEKVAFDNAMQI
jgi:malate dehydrogenase